MIIHGGITMYVAEHHSIDQLRELIRVERRAKIARRLQAVLLAKQGLTAPQIGKLVPMSRRVIQSWVYRYNGLGREGLCDRYRGGNKNKLDQHQQQQLKTHIDKAADDPHDGIRRGQDVRQWLKEQFGVCYSLSGIYDVLHRLGYRPLMPRPRHYKADPQAQEAFKKTSARS